MINKIINMPKVELHLHLDGSVPIDLLAKLSNLSREEVIKKVVSEKDNNLKDYLQCFDFIDDLLQTKESLEEAAESLGHILEKEDVIYAEVRFAPISHIKGGLSLDEVVESVLSGLKKCKVKTNLILCLRRGVSYEKNLEVLKLASRFINKGVVAVDLVGDEDRYPFKNYHYLFKVCQKANIPTTIHSGETTKRDILDVLPYTKRLGHGIKIFDDDNLIQEVKKRDILLEVCPNSNIDTHNVTNYYTHPIKALYDKGVKVCVNTDNRTVSDITLVDEYLNLYYSHHFVLNDFKKMNMYALDKAFISKKERKELKDIIKNY